MIEWVAGIEPDPRRDLRALMALHQLSAQRWTDPVNLASLLQLTVEVSRQAAE